MAFKFPFTNYHELNLTWVLDQLKKLFEESAENVNVIENYNGRLTAVETELPLVADTAQDAAQSSAAAASLAQTAKSTADTAQENAIQAQAAAGQARQEAQAAQRAADAATQAAQQAQATAQNFDGRITQAQNNAAEALEASRSFENRVQAAITTANNAAQTATNAQGIATRADQNAALALDTLNAQRSELERIGAEQVELITEETENGKTEIENLAQSVLDSIPSDYTALSNLVDKKAPVIINSASGAMASFNDGADNMKIQKLVVNIEPVQAGSGDPSPDNVRPISGWTGAEISASGVNIWNEEWINGYYDTTGNFVSSPNYICSKNKIMVDPDSYYYLHFPVAMTIRAYDSNRQFIGTAPGTWRNETFKPAGYFSGVKYITFNSAASGALTTYNNDISINYPATDTTYHPYTGNQISVTFPSEAGTVYDGTLDVISGKLVVDKGIVTFDGSQPESELGHTPVPEYVQVSWIPFMQTGTPNAVFICDRYKYQHSAGLYKIWPSSVPRMFLGVPPELTTHEALSTYFRNNPVTVIYPIATPVEYQLTTQEVKTLLSVNNIWADAGDVEVTYPADTKLYIDGKLAELQATILENI